MSWTSASRKRLYYLNGGSEVRFLAPDGSAGTATRITIGPNQQAGFAVSPDDTRIAVAILSYSLPSTGSQSPLFANYDGMRLYVEDLDGGGHHLDIFSSPTEAGFPIGWLSGRLLLAVGAPTCCEVVPINPYGATSYHVVDPATGSRLASLCENSDGPEGPIEPAGATCFRSGLAPEYQRWNGTHFAAPAAVPNPSQYLNALSPDGTQVAVGGDSISIWGPLGRSVNLHESGYVFGWLDPDRIAFLRPNGNALSVLETKTGVATDIFSGGAYMGTFPAAIT